MMDFCVAFIGCWQDGHGSWMDFPVLMMNDLLFMMLLLSWLMGEGWINVRSDSYDAALLVGL